VSSGLVIVDVTHRTNPAGVQRIRDFMSSGLRGFATLEEAADAIAAYTPHRPRRVNPAGLMKVLRQKRDGRWYWHWDPKFLEGGRTEVPRRDFEALFHVAMRNIRVPTLLVRGKLSDVVTEEGVQEFLQQIPGAKAVDVGGAAHMVAGDQNDAFSQAVIEFLEQDVRPTLRDRR
jgi:pimeloyl-ACP methyl ester carboxylesterase